MPRTPNRTPKKPPKDLIDAKTALTILKNTLTIQQCNHTTPLIDLITSVLNSDDNTVTEEYFSLLQNPSSNKQQKFIHWATYISKISNKHERITQYVCSLLESSFGNRNELTKAFFFTKALFLSRFSHSNVFDNPDYSHMILRFLQKLVESGYFNLASTLLYFQLYKQKKHSLPGYWVLFNLERSKFPQLTLIHEKLKSFHEQNTTTFFSYPLNKFIKSNGDFSSVDNNCSMLLEKISPSDSTWSEEVITTSTTLRSNDFSSFASSSSHTNLTYRYDLSGQPIICSVQNAPLSLLPVSFFATTHHLATDEPLANTSGESYSSSLTAETSPRYQQAFEAQGETMPQTNEYEFDDFFDALSPTTQQAIATADETPSLLLESEFNTFWDAMSPTIGQAIAASNEISLPAPEYEIDSFFETITPTNPQATAIMESTLLVAPNDNINYASSFIAREQYFQTIISNISFFIENNNKATSPLFFSSSPDFTVNFLLQQISYNELCEKICREEQIDFADIQNNFSLFWLQKIKQFAEQRLINLEKELDQSIHSPSTLFNRMGT